MNDNELFAILAVLPKTLSYSDMINTGLKYIGVMTRLLHDILPGL